MMPGYPPGLAAGDRHDDRDLKAGLSGFPWVWVLEVDGERIAQITTIINT
jgi:hypothetical protein